MATMLRRPDPIPSRAAQRKQRLLELENEQRIEDAEALKFTDEQRLSLFLSFRSVKFEWSDLDGMRSVRRRYNSSYPASPPPPVRSPTHSLLQPQVQVTPPQTQSRDPARPPALPLPPHTLAPTPEAFTVLTNAHLASFGKDDTICVRRGYGSAPQTPSPYDRYCSTPTPYDSAPRYQYAEAVSFPSTPAPIPISIPACPTTPAPTPMARSVSSPPGVSLGSCSSSSPSPAPSARRSPPSYPSPKPSRSSPRGKRRSPVKGLFSSSSAAGACIQPIRVPLPPLSSAALEGGDEDDDAWVDEDEDGDATFIASSGEQEGDDVDESALPTPVASSVWRFGEHEPPALRVDVGSLAPPAYEEEEPQTPVPYEREATPTPFACDERDSEQVGGKRKR